MPPKGKVAPPPPNPVDAVADVVQKLKAVVIADLAGPLKELLTVVETPGGVEEIVRAADAILPPVASCLHGQVAGVLVDELTSVHIAAVEAAARLVHALVGLAPDSCGMVCSADFAGLFVSLLHPGPDADAEWKEAGEPSPRAEVARHACVAVAAIASLPEGCARVRHGAIPPLLEIMSLSNIHLAPLQTEAASALACCAGSALGRIQLREAGIHPLLDLVVPPAAGEAPDITRLRARAVQVLGQCMYDAVLRGMCLKHGLMGSAVRLLCPRAPVNSPSPEAVEAQAELQATIASLLAIAGQAPQGRTELLAAGAPAPLLRIVALEPVYAGAPPPNLPLLANTALAVAHLALLLPAAEALGTAAVRSLVSLLVPAPPAPLLPAQPQDWDAVRGNACVAIGALLQVDGALRCLLAAETEGVQALASLVVEAGVPPSLRAAATDVFGRVARSEEGRTAVMEVAGDAVGVLLARMQDPDAAASPEELESCLCSLAALAAHHSVRAMLRGETDGALDDPVASPAKPTAGGPETVESKPPPPLASLVQLLGAEAPPVRRAAAVAIAATCHGGDVASASLLVSWGAVGALSTLTRQRESGAAAAAATALRAVCLAIPSAMLWLTSEIPIGMSLGEPCCVVPSNAAYGDMETMRALPPDTDGADVLIVSNQDEALAALVAQAQPHIDRAATHDAAASALARLVSGAMGGSVSYEGYESFDATAESAALRKRVGSCAMPVGELKRGGARARAVLFKAVADRCGLPCGLRVGRCVSGAHAHHAWATVVAGDGLAVVDLLHSPGALLPAESEAAQRYQRVGQYAFSSLASSRVEPFVPQKLAQA